MRMHNKTDDKRTVLLSSVHRKDDKRIVPLSSPCHLFAIALGVVLLGLVACTGPAVTDPTGSGTEEATLDDGSKSETVTGDGTNLTGTPSSSVTEEDPGSTGEESLDFSEISDTSEDGSPYAETVIEPILEVTPTPVVEEPTPTLTAPEPTSEVSEPTSIPEAPTPIPVEPTPTPVEPTPEVPVPTPTEIPPTQAPPAPGGEIIDVSTTLYTYDMMQRDLAYLAATYPDRLKLYSAGTTADGRDLSYVVFGNENAPRQIYICAATHAREYMTTQLVMRQLAWYCTQYDTGSYNGIPYSQLFSDICFYVQPMVNPDGVTISQLGENGLRREDLKANLRNIFASDLNAGFAETSDYNAYLVRWKANALGVDMNRNFSPGWETVHERSAPSSTFYKGTEPGSEAETQAQMAIVNSMSNPLMAISYHSYGDLIYWQYGQGEPLWSANEALAARISGMTGQYLAGYSNEAGFSNWCILVKGIRSVTVETGTVPCPLPLYQMDELWPEHREVWALLVATE